MRKKKGETPFHYYSHSNLSSKNLNNQQSLKPSFVCVGREYKTMRCEIMYLFLSIYSYTESNLISKKTIQKHTDTHSYIQIYTYIKREG